MARTSSMCRVRWRRPRLHRLPEGASRSNPPATPTLQLQPAWLHKRNRGAPATCRRAQMAQPQPKTGADHAFFGCIQTTNLRHLVSSKLEQGLFKFKPTSKRDAQRESRWRTTLRFGFSPALYLHKEKRGIYFRSNLKHLIHHGASSKIPYKWWVKANHCFSPTVVLRICNVPPKSRDTLKMKPLTWNHTKQHTTSSTWVRLFLSLSLPSCLGWGRPDSGLPFVSCLNTSNNGL